MEECQATTDNKLLQEKTLSKEWMVKGDVDNKEREKTVPKEVRFNLEEGAEAEQEKEDRPNVGKTKEEEVVIKFNPEHQPQDNLSALSRSIGKQWEDDKSIIVWETND